MKKVGEGVKAKNGNCLTRARESKRASRFIGWRTQNARICAVPYCGKKDKVLTLRRHNSKSPLVSRLLPRGVFIPRAADPKRANGVFRRRRLLSCMPESFYSSHAFSFSPLLVVLFELLHGRWRLWSPRRRIAPRRDSGFGALHRRQYSAHGQTEQCVDRRPSAKQSEQCRHGAQFLATRTDSKHPDHHG